MKRFLITNLTIFLTDSCNFKCLHCMRGEQVGVQIQEESLNNLFRQAKNIANLSICGGEPFTRPDLLEMLVDIIIKHNVTINEFGIVTNGTLYSKEIEQILDRLNEYSLSCPSLVNTLPNDSRGHISLSADYYHVLELEKIKSSNPDIFAQYRESIKTLMESKYYEGKRDLSGLFDLGRATSLKVYRTTYKPIPKIYYQKKDVILCGPILSMLDDGTISECDGELDDLKKKYNYGNINQESLEDIIKRNSKRVYTLQSFNRKKEKILRWYQTYK